MAGRFAWALRTTYAAHAPYLILTAICTVALAIVPVGMVWVGKQIIDAVVAGDQATLIQGLIAEACLSVLLLLLQVASGHALGLLQIRVGFLGQQIVLDRAARVPYARFEQPAFYDALSRALPEAGRRPIAVLSHLLGVLGAALGLLGSAALLAGVSPLIGVAMLVSSLPRFFADRWFQRAWFDMQSARAPLYRELSYFETLLTQDSGAREIRLFGLADRLLAARRDLFDGAWKADSALSTRRTSVTVLTGAVQSAIFVGVHAWVGLAAIRGEVTVGDITLVLTAFQSGEGSISQLLQSAGLLYEDRLYLGHIDNFFQMAAPEPTGGQRVGPHPDDGLRFEQVCFRYEGAERDAVHDVSFHLRPGRTVALVGVNGAGKSTLIKLAIGLHVPTAGRILLDGLDVAAWDKHALRARLSALFQDFVRYQRTALANITLDAPADDDVVRRAVHDALAEPLIAALPQGIQTRLGRWFEQGVELSGGQWQKIALARAFFRQDAALWLLDEPSAAMDPEAEVALLNRLRADHPERGVLLVSHRFNAVRLADEILVLEAGQIVEAGDHDQLLQQNGRYAQLFHTQAEGYR